jgi:hypothetical protein
MPSAPQAQNKIFAQGFYRFPQYVNMPAQERASNITAT